MRSHDEDMICGDEGLEAIASAVAYSAEPMPVEARAAVRERLLATIEPSAIPLHVRLIRPVIAFATAGALLGGVSYAAATSAPGETFFGLKQSIVSTVRSAQSVLASRTHDKPVPAVLTPVEAPARKPAVTAPGIPQFREAAPKAAEATHVAPGQSKGKAQGNGKSNGNGASGSKKSVGSGRKQTHRSSRGSKR